MTSNQNPDDDDVAAIRFGPATPSGSRHRDT
jgi:hypothetical protein